jgi:hypothetical protein
VELPLPVVGKQQTTRARSACIPRSGGRGGRPSTWQKGVSPTSLARKGGEATLIERPPHSRAKAGGGASRTRQAVGRLAPPQTPQPLDCNKRGPLAGARRASLLSLEVHVAKRRATSPILRPTLIRGASSKLHASDSMRSCSHVSEDGGMTSEHHRTPFRRPPAASACASRSHK